jgi:hypothetical protein
VQQASQLFWLGKGGDQAERCRLGAGLSMRGLNLVGPSQVTIRLSRLVAKLSISKFSGSSWPLGICASVAAWNAGTRSHRDRAA